MNETALIIIDMQDGILEDADYPIVFKDQLLSNINRLIKEADDSGILTVFIRHTEAQGTPLEINQPGWHITSKLLQPKHAIYIDKRTPDSFHQTQLKNILDEHGISKIVIAGVQTDYCIDTTCRRAFSLGYQTMLVSDAHSSCDSQYLMAAQIIRHHNQVLGNWFVRLIETNEVKFKI
jgi:nicotinamidase-related amidase